MNEENAVDELDTDFQCVVCQQIVVEPEKCYECEHYFCKECVNRIRDYKNACPNDRSTPFTTTKLSRMERKGLDNLKFKCKAGKVFNYEGA